jgi:Fe-S-cluster containining protein
MKNTFDCSKCPGYCCSHPRIAVSDYDIVRLAKHFDLPVAKARKKFTYPYVTKDANEVLLRHQKDTVYKTICQFFDLKERRCTVYEARPNVCRKYPYGNKCGYYSFLKFEREHQDDEEFIPTA